MSFIDDQRAEDERNANRRRAFINRLNLMFGIAPKGTKKGDDGYWIPPKKTTGGLTGGPINNPSYSGSTEPWMNLPVWKSIKDPVGLANKSRHNMESVYGRIGSAVENFQNSRLQDDLDRTQREARFELARRGQLGGSVAVDVGRDIRRLNDDRRLDIANLSTQAVTDARTKDNEARLSAIRDINSDVDAGSAIAGALNQRALSANQSIDFGKGQLLGDAFANLAYLYGKVRDARAVQQARQNYGGFGPSTGIATVGGSGGAGRVTGG